jgi:hypothetical protein
MSQAVTVLQPGERCRTMPDEAAAYHIVNRIHFVWARLDERSIHTAFFLAIRRLTDKEGWHKWNLAKAEERVKAAFTRLRSLPRDTAARAERVQFLQATPPSGPPPDAKQLIEDLANWLVATANNAKKDETSAGQGMKPPRLGGPASNLLDKAQALAAEHGVVVTLHHVLGVMLDGSNTETFEILGPAWETDGRRTNRRRLVAAINARLSQRTNEAEFDLRRLHEHAKEIAKGREPKEVHLLQALLDTKYFLALLSDHNADPSVVRAEVAARIVPRIWVEQGDDDEEGDFRNDVWDDPTSWVEKPAGALPGPDEPDPEKAAARLRMVLAEVAEMLPEVTASADAQSVLRVALNPPFFVVARTRRSGAGYLEFDTTWDQEGLAKVIGWPVPSKADDEVGKRVRSAVTTAKRAVERIYTLAAEGLEAGSSKRFALDADELADRLTLVLEKLKAMLATKRAKQRSER